MEKQWVWVVEKIEEYDGAVDTKIKIFKNKEDAIKQKEEWKEKDYFFINDVKSDIDNECYDSRIDDDELYFYAYDSFNFDSLTIDIREMEVL